MHLRLFGDLRVQCRRPLLLFGLLCGLLLCFGDGLLLYLCLGRLGVERLPDLLRTGQTAHSLHRRGTDLRLRRLLLSGQVHRRAGLGNGALLLDGLAGLLVIIPVRF